VQVDALSDSALSARIEALACLGHAEFGMEEFAAASDHLDRGIRIARATGQNSWFLLLMCLFGVSELWQGRLESAERASNTAVESALLRGGEPLVWARTLQCWVSTLRGDIRDAIRIGEEAASLADQSGSFIFGWLAHFCLGEALLAVGDADRAAAEVIAHVGGESLSAVEPSWRPHIWEVMAAVSLMQGDVETAEKWIHRAEEVAAELALDGRIGEARRARAALDLARGDAAAAATAARDAVQRFTAIGRVVDAGRTELLLGRSLLALGDSDSAEEAFERGYRVLADCGARRAADGAARELRRLGRRVPRAGARRRDGTDGQMLTKREQEVADLVARGQTNRQIADELFLSAKTVESHLARIFEKLAVSSRAGVAGAVERARRPGDDSKEPTIGRSGTTPV
jgi:ATP/maltotriose-dependent transcriptional regulator MalT